MIAEYLRKRGTNFAILSRAYRSSAEDNGLIFNSSSPPRESVRAVGDEITLLTRRLPNTWFGVGKDRLRNANELDSRHGIKVFLLDDGFQHLRLHRDCDIVLIDALNPFGNGSILPAGNLREPTYSLYRASLILLTRTESVDQEDLLNIRRQLPRNIDANRVFELKTVINRFSDLATGETVDIESLTET